MSRKLKVLIAKPGLDGHESGARVVARALRDAGMEVIYIGTRQTPEMIVNAGLQEGVDVIGLSILSGIHMDASRSVLNLLREKGMEHVAVVIGGIIPEEDKAELRQMGVKGVFGPGTKISEVVKFVEQLAPENIRR
jgi:methylmalonyl-CoA mutase C-terminal domain/subunit